MRNRIRLFKRGAFLRGRNRARLRPGKEPSRRMMQGDSRAMRPAKEPVPQEPELFVQEILTIEEWQRGRTPASKSLTRLFYAYLSAQGCEAPIKCHKRFLAPSSGGVDFGQVQI